MLTRTCLLLFLAGASLAHAQPGGTKLKKELAELQGVWRLIGFEAAARGIEGFEQGQLGLDTPPPRGIGDVLCASAAFGLVLAITVDRGQVGLAPRGVAGAVELGALP